MPTMPEITAILVEWSDGSDKTLSITSSSSTQKNSTQTENKDEAKDSPLDALKDKIAGNRQQFKTDSISNENENGTAYFFRKDKDGKIYGFCIKIPKNSSIELPTKEVNERNQKKTFHLITKKPHSIATSTDITSFINQTFTLIAAKANDPDRGNRNVSGDFDKIIAASKPKVEVHQPETKSTPGKTPSKKPPEAQSASAGVTNTDSATKTDSGQRKDAKRSAVKFRDDANDPSKTETKETKDAESKQPAHLVNNHSKNAKILAALIKPINSNPVISTVSIDGDNHSNKLQTRLEAKKSEIIGGSLDAKYEDENGPTFSYFTKGVGVIYGFSVKGQISPQRRDEIFGNLRTIYTSVSIEEGEEKAAAEKFIPNLNQLVSNTRSVDTQRFISEQAQLNKGALVTSATGLQRRQQAKDSWCSRFFKCCCGDDKNNFPERIDDYQLLSGGDQFVDQNNPGIQYK